MIILRTKHFANTRKIAKAAARLARESAKAAKLGKPTPGVVDAALKATELKGLYRIPKTESARRGLRRVLTNTSNHTWKNFVGKDHEAARGIKKAFEGRSQQLIDQSIMQAGEIASRGGKSHARKEILKAYRGSLK